MDRFYIVVQTNICSYTEAERTYVRPQGLGSLNEHMFA